jgi:hypothetical protein
MMKKQLFLIFLFSLVFNLVQNISLAQAPDFKWARPAGSISDDRGNAISVTPNGDSYVFGTFESPTIEFGGIILTNSGGPGNPNAFLVKYNLNGNAIWARSFSGDCLGEVITTDINGNCYVSGSFLSNNMTIGNIILYNSWWGSREIFIAKYDENGNLVWAKSAGGSSTEVVRSVTVDAAGNSYITGYFQSGSSMTFGTITITNNSTNIFIAKYDSNGNTIWAKSLGGNDLDYGVGISVDTIGNLYISGHFNSPTITFGTTTLTNVGSTTDFFIAKCDNNGNFLWAKDAGGIDYDYSSGIAIDIMETVVSLDFHIVLLLLSEAPL